MRAPGRVALEAAEDEQGRGRARRRPVKAATAASLVLTVSRADRATRLSDDEMRAAVELRLGSTEQLKHKACNCIGEGWVDKHHFMHCRANAREIVWRHDRLRDAAVESLAESGVVAWTEPERLASNSHSRPDLVARMTRNETGNEMATTMVDVTVANPTARSAHSHNGRDQENRLGSANVEGASANQREKKKHERYVKVYEAVNKGTMVMVPFGVEYSGRLGEQAKRFIKKAAVTASTGGIEDEGSFTTRMALRVTMAIHRGNGRIWARHQLRLQADKISNEEVRARGWHSRQKDDSTTDDDAPEDETTEEEDSD